MHAAADDGERLDAAFAAAGEITRTATALDGAVTVEVAVGGRVLDVRLTRAALRSGPTPLAAAVTQAAEQATTLANRAAQVVYQRALGSRAERYLDRLGLAPAGPGEPAGAGANGRRRPPPPAREEDEDYPESWLT